MSWCHCSSMVITSSYFDTMPALFVSTDFLKGIGFDQRQRGSCVQGRAVSVG